MKKIFTLLFFVGLVSAAFAQDGRHAQYRNQPVYNQAPASAYNSSYNHNTDFNNQHYAQVPVNNYAVNNERNFRDDVAVADFHKRFEHDRFVRHHVFFDRFHRGCDRW